MKNCRCTDNSTCGVTSCGRKPSGHCSGGQYDLRTQDDEDTQSDEAEADAAKPKKNSPKKPK